MEKETIPIGSGSLSPELPAQKNDLPATGQEGHLATTFFTSFPDTEEPDEELPGPFTGDFRRLLGCGG